MRFLPLFALLAISGFHCKNNSSSEKKEETFRPAEEQPAPAISPDRTNVRKAPAAQYAEELPGGFQYKAELYETPKTFSYFLKLKYQEFTAEDTVTLPDFGIMPEPVLKKGEGKNVILLGFKDKKGEFREYKTITASDDKISVKTSKYYTVTKYSTTVQ